MSLNARQVHVEVVSPHFSSTPLKAGATAPQIYKGPPLGVIAIDPGSFNLRIGLASEDNNHPVIVPQCIAWRRDGKSSSLSKSDVNISRSNLVEVSDKDADEMQVDEQSDDIDVISERAEKERGPQQRTLRREVSKLEHHPMVKEAFDAIAKQADQLRAITRSLDDEKALMQTLPKEQDAAFEFTTIEDPPQKYIFGEDALFLDDQDPYDVVFPLAAGRFNTSRGFSHQVLVDSLQRIWEWAISDKLSIPLNDITKYDVVVTIEDQFDQRTVHEIVDILLRRMCFRSCAIHKSSVCAAIGAGLTNCCVVDLGFARTTVSCIEETEVASAQMFPFGGIDLSRLLVHIMKDFDPERFKFRYSDVDSSLDQRMQDLLIFEEMKESVCHMDPGKATPQVYEFCVRHRTTDTRLFRINVDSAQLSVPMALFNPSPLSMLIQKTPPVKLFNLEDSHRHAFGEPLPRKQSISPLQAVIVNTIQGVPGVFNQQRLFSRLLLVGGGSMMPGAKEMFEDIIFYELPDHVERVEVVPIQTGPTGLTCSWRGACILGLQMPRAFWIDRGRWLERGALTFRERLPFPWDTAKE